MPLSPVKALDFLLTEDSLNEWMTPAWLNHAERADMLFWVLRAAGFDVSLHRATGEKLLDEMREHSPYGLALCVLSFPPSPQKHSIYLNLPIETQKKFFMTDHYSHLTDRGIVWEVVRDKTTDLSEVEQSLAKIDANHDLIKALQYGLALLQKFSMEHATLRSTKIKSALRI